MVKARVDQVKAADLEGGDPLVIQGQAGIGQALLEDRLAATAGTPLLARSDDAIGSELAL